jgi:lysophospholipase L1-like esterase
MQPRILPTLSALAVLLLAGASAAGAREIVVFGDSWGFAIAPALQQVLDSMGHDVTVVNAAVPGARAAQLSRPPGLQDLSDTLNAHPDADLVQLSIGGNDFLDNWNPELSAAQEDALFQAIVDDIETIVQHILSQGMDLQVFQASYDYPRPLPIGTPLQVNTASEQLASRLQALDQATERMRFHNHNGLMQVHFGFGALGIPPFDPSLPRIDLPGPEEAFVDAIHLTAEGYLIFAGANYDSFYRWQLARTVPVLSPWALALAALSVIAASSATLRSRAGGRRPGLQRLVGLPHLKARR